MSEFFTALKPFDDAALRLVNQTWTSPALDWFFPAITDLHKTLLMKIAALVLFAFLIYRLGRWGAIFFMSLAVTVGIDDALGGQLIKPFFARPRPTQDSIARLIVRAPEFGGYGFMSNHAMNVFCIFGFLFFVYRRGAWYFLPVAILVAYSRVYCGVHYPTDVLFGAAFGFLVGLIGGKITSSFYQRRQSVG